MNEGGIKKLIPVLPEEPSERDKSNPPTEKSFSSNKNYQLTSIERLEDRKYIEAYKNLESLDIKGNFISNLKLKSYHNLLKLNASTNQISRVELHLPQLATLDLSHNNISEMFELIDLPNLSELDLSYNSLKEISYDSFKYVKAKLTKLNLSDNLIEFPEVRDFFNFTDNFGSYMKKLAILDLYDNPFTTKKKYKDHYGNLIKASFNKIQVLNGKDVSNYNVQLDIRNIKEKMIQLEKQQGAPIPENKNVRWSKRKEKVTFKVINNSLLKITQKGKLNNKIFDDLDDLIDNYLKNVSKKVLEEENDNVQDEELDDFEIFLDYIEKIFDSLPGFEVRIYKILGQFSVTKYGKFASRALGCIKQRIGGENSEQIKEVLNVIIIFIKETSPENIPVNLIESLQFFLNEQKFINEMKIILRHFLSLLGKICRNIDFSFNQNNVENKILISLFNGLIEFVSKAIQTYFYNDEIIKIDFIKSIAYNLKKLLNEKDDDIIRDAIHLSVLKNLLLIMRELCLMITNNQIEKPKDFLNLVIGSGIRDIIEQRLPDLLMAVYKKDIDDKYKDIEKQKLFLKKQETTMFIQSYGAFISCSPEINKYIESNSVSMKIVMILAQNIIIDPLLTHAACDFTYFVLLNKQILLDEKKFNAFVSKLYNLRYVIPLLFPQEELFKQLCLIAEKYGDRACERGKPIDIRNMNSEIISNVLISATRLIGIFGKYSHYKNKVGEICINICSEMNKLNRDSALSNCLLSPNEDVKLSVVNCFFTVNPEELDPEELAGIYRQLKYLSSISGKMQIIVAMMFILINRWFVSNLIKKENSKIETSKEAIFIAMDLLYKNELKKGGYEKTNTNKTNLSAILIMFLINVSCFDFTKKYFFTPKNLEEIVKVLESEEESPNVGFPLEIEKCRCGWSIENILTIIQKGINPYNYVSLRLLLHMGDVLLNREYPIFDTNEYLECNEVIEKTLNEMKKRERERIQEEALNWRVVDDMKMKKKYSNSIKLNPDEVKKQQEIFVKNFHYFLEFVLGQLSEKQISKYGKIMESKFSNEIDRIKYSAFEYPIDTGDYYEGNLIDETNDKTKIEDEKDEEDASEDDNESLYEKFRDYLKEEDYDPPYANSNLDNFNKIQGELLHYSKYGYNEILKRETSEETPDNVYLRSLFISAFFRCIYAVLEFSENISNKENLITQLYRKDTLKTICHLAECTKFSDNNIATKFLVIMRHVLRNSKVYYNQFKSDSKNQKKEIQNDFLERLGNISYMIRRIVKRFKKDMNIEKDEHKILLSEICLCSANIISELQMIGFDSDKIQERTMTTMVDYDLISLLIIMIKEYMNKEVNHSISSNIYDDKLLVEMVTTSKNIIGEYMSKAHSRKYDILESLTRSYIFERVKMRQCFIKEIIESSENSRIKGDISTAINSNIILIAPVNIVKYNTTNGLLRLLVITDSEFKFAEINDEKNLSDQNYHNFDENLTVPIKDIEAVIMFDYANRMLIQSNNEENQEIGLFFYKMNTSSLVRDFIKEINRKIDIYQNVLTFANGDIRDLNQGMIEKSKDNSITMDETNDGNTPLLGEEREEKMKKLKEEISCNQKTIIINCVFEVSNFCDFFVNWFRKKEIVKKGKVVVIRDKQILVYEELYEMWNKLNVKSIFENVKKLGNRRDNGSLNIGSFEHCFNYITQYDVGEFVSMKLVGATVLQLKRSNGGYIAFDIVDDMSYVKFREGLKLKEEFEMLNINLNP